VVCPTDHRHHKTLQIPTALVIAERKGANISTTVDMRLMHTASLYTVYTSMHQCHQLQPCRHFLPQKSPHTSLHPPETKTGTFLPVHIPWDTNILG